MTDRDAAALDGYPLLPRLLHDVVDPDPRCSLLERDLPSPIVPVRRSPPFGRASAGGLQVIDGDALLGASGGAPIDAAGETYGDPEAAETRGAFGAGAGAVALLPPAKMGELMPRVRRLAARGVAALALDLTRLADSPPFGDHPWHPRHRDELAELRAAAGCPLWLYGVCGAADAEVAAEAALEGVVVHGGAGRHLGGPAAIHVLPEVIDAVAGMLGVYAGGAVRGGVDVFRYLAVGAEAVLVESDRSRANLDAELRYAMRLTGCATLEEIGWEALFAPLFRTD